MIKIARLSFGVALLQAGFFASHLAHATAPSVRFRDMARGADCIVVASPVRSISANEYEFESLAFVSGPNCASDHFTVQRSSAETRGEYARAPYVLFLRRIGSRRFAYAGEPFGAMSITDGIVSTYAFLELPRSMPLEKLFELVRSERGEGSRVPSSG